MKALLICMGHVLSLIGCVRIPATIIGLVMHAE